MQDAPRAGLPVRALLLPAGLYLALRQISPDDLRDPFMLTTVQRSSTPDVVVHIPTAEIGRSPPDSAPAGLIFHVGRCGSTALSQALKEHGDVVVYAEPPPVNDLLSSSHAWSRSEIVMALRSLGGAFAAHAGRPYVLKLSSWNTLYCDVLLEAFPDAPWLFMVRDPLEVGVAVLREPPPWFLGDTGPARSITALVDRGQPSRSPEEFCARLYAASCDAVVRSNISEGRLVRYEDLEPVVTELAPTHFSIPVSDDQRARMRQSLGAYAKAPLDKPAPFTPDADQKRSMASDALRGAVADVAAPALARVTALFARS